MKTTKHLFLLLSLLMALLVSCDSDNNDDGNGGNNPPPTINYGPKNVFTGDLPQRIGESTVKYNADGLVEEISNKYEKVLFEYPSEAKSTADNTTIVMKYVDMEYEEDSYMFFLEIGDNGFVSKAFQTFSDNSTETWEFNYYSDGLLSNMKRSEGNETTTTELLLGNICNVRVWPDDEQAYRTSIDYTSKKYQKGIENKGCIMLFDVTLGIDMDEMVYAYYAGLLGKANQNLPLTMRDSDGYTYEFEWTLNDKGYPTKLTYDDNGHTETVDFKW